MIIIKYECDNEFKFTSFLDMRNAFQRTLNRCKIKINMSQGFNPHELVFYNDPDSLGISSKANYALIDTDCDENILLEDFNKKAPIGLKATNISKINEKLNFNTTFKYAKYIVCCNKEINVKKLNDLLKQNEIIVKKEKNNENSDIDIKQKIYSIKSLSNNSYEMIITYGQEKLSPYLLVDYISNLLEIKREECEVIKTNVYILENNKLIDVDNIFLKNNFQNFSL